jgi:hypothetical protein
MKKKLKISQATQKGYIEIEEGGVFDAAYPSSKTRRGRVQGGYDMSDNNVWKRIAFV